MKLIRNIILSFILMFTMTSCEDWFYIDRIGKPVEFGITTGKSIKTRTIYSGDITNGKERLEWIDGDDVRIWMYWDEDRNNSYESGPEWADYKVINNRPSYEKSYGKLSPKNGTSLRWKGDFTGDNGRAREYLHEFYSIYPANSGKDFDGTNITFNIPATQSGVNMKFAYMTAYKDKVTSLRDDNNPNSYVELEYYPRVTTLYIAVVNDTDETINGGNIILKSSESSSPISGNYIVNIPDYSSGELKGNNDDGWEITNSIKTLNKKGDSDTVAFFIRPRQYASNELSLTFNGKTQKLNKDFEPNYKYNIKITVSGKVEIDDALAQMILAYMRSFGDGDNFYKKFKSFIDKYYPENNGHLNFWNSFTKSVDVLQVDGAGKRLSSFFGDKLNDFIAALGEIEEISLNSGGYEIKSDSLKIDNTIFKNLKKIDLQLNKDIKIYVKDLDSLTTFSVVNGSNGTLSLYCEDCSSLKTISVMPDGAKVNKLSLIRTPKFESATIKNMNQSEMDIYLEDCSTSEDVTNAYIQIENKNTKKNVTRVGNNTSKVKIE